MPVPDAVFLPTVSASPVAAYGMRRLVTGYAGPLFEVQRASDNATMDVPQLANGLPDAAAAATWAAGAATTIRTWHDQTGNARHAQNTVVAEQPIFDASGQFGECSAFNAFKALVNDGWRIPSSTRFPKRLNIPTTVTFNRNNFSAFMVVEPKTSLHNEGYINFVNGSTSFLALVTAGSTTGLQASGGTATESGRRPRTQYQTIGILAGASLKFLQDGQIITTTGKSSAVVLGGLLGDTLGAGDFYSADNYLGVVLYPAAISDADAIVVRNALDTTFGIVAPTANQIVMVGDSILNGPFVTQGSKNRQMTRKLRAMLKGNPALYNLGLPSQTLDGIATNAATREFALAADGAYGKRILVIQGGTNDFGTNGGTAGYGATKYSALTTYIGNARAAGFTHILVCTLLPRSNTPDWQNPASQRWVELNDYNARVRANAASADGIIDLAAHPVMGLFANASNLAYYQDGLHPTASGDLLLADPYATTINALL